MNEELRIKEILSEKKLSIRGLAEIMGIDPASLSRSLSGKMTLDTLKKIASALNVEIWQLFTTTISKEELTALIDYRGRLYKAGSIEELEKIIEEIKKER
ncbi:MAG: helix-turn-helix transcriptional regulator [Prevotella sp.]|jgi:transcriptional regulator with XRE-family HTH domain|nr:helix-turn-helix transcriptional regulator [Prevotella sp.]